jgi:3-methyladenine DNA glycosylase AlkD
MICQINFYIINKQVNLEYLDLIKRLSDSNHIFVKKAKNFCVNLDYDAKTFVKDKFLFFVHQNDDMQ